MDFSAAKANRMNLAGSQSGLIFHAIRIINLVKQMFRDKVVRFVIENVASMDPSARDEITSLLQVRPFKVDPRKQVPMARPRFCWTDIPAKPTQGVQFVDHDGYCRRAMA